MGTEICFELEVYLSISLTQQRTRLWMTLKTNIFLPADILVIAEGRKPGEKK